MSSINQVKINKYIAGVMCFLLLLAALPVKTALAASATITLSATEEEFRVGDTVEVKLTISADDTIGDFEAFISYDDAVLEFYSAASCITGDAGMLKVYDWGASPSAQDRTYRIFFKAIAQGECEISLFGRPMVYCYSGGGEMSVTGVSKTITVLPSVMASDDSSLSALYLVDSGAKTVSLNPLFSSEITNYTAAVPYESEMVIVSAITTDSLASVKVTGGQKLDLGDNKVLVTVTAENGTETVYTIHIYRTEFKAEPETEDEKPEQQEVVLQPGILFENTEEQVLVTEYHTYTVCDKPEDFVLPDGYEQTTLMINGIQVTAYARQGASREEFLLLVLENEAGEANWYCYDRVEQTLQRMNEEEYIVTQVIQSNDEGLKAAVQEYEFNQSMLTFAVAFLLGLCLVLLMVILWLCIRRRNRG